VWEKKERKKKKTFDREISPGSSSDSKTGPFDGIRNQQFSELLDQCLNQILPLLKPFFPILRAVGGTAHIEESLFLDLKSPGE